MFLSLALLLRTLTAQQLKDVWQEVSFKCLDDWSVFPKVLTFKHLGICYLIKQIKYILFILSL